MVHLQQMAFSYELEYIIGRLMGWNSGVLVRSLNLKRIMEAPEVSGEGF